MIDRLLNEAFKGMKMLSPLYWIALLITIIVVFIIAIRTSNKSEKEGENIFSLLIIITPYVPFVLSSLWYLITKTSITFGLMLDWIFALGGSFLLYAVTSFIFLLFLYLCLKGLDSINVVSFNRDNIFDVFFGSTFGFIYTYILLSFLLFNQFYCMLT